MSSDPNASCIVCGSSARKSSELSETELRALYLADVGHPPGSDVEFSAVAEYECSDCGLGFSQPMCAGNGAFYEWISKDEPYYPNGRWEFSVLRDILTKQLRSDIVGLDIGCGSGAFLETVRGLRGVRFSGIDTNATAVRLAISRGLDVRLEALESVAASSTRFDVVTAFHCLEHVVDPKSFIGYALDLLSEQGSLFVSVPLTPTVLEIDGFDPRNHSPHHLTRWSESALGALARTHRAEVSFVHPPVARSIVRAMFNTTFRFGGGAKGLGAASPAMLTLLHPLHTLKVWRRLRAAVSGGKPFNDLILCRLQKR